MKDTNKNCRRRKVRVASKKNQKHHQQQRKATFSYEKLVRQFLLHALHHTYKLEETSKVNVPFYGRLSTLMLFNYYLQWFLMLCNLCWGRRSFMCTQQRVCSATFPFSSSALSVIFSKSQQTLFIVHEKRLRMLQNFTVQGEKW